MPMQPDMRKQRPLTAPPLPARTGLDLADVTIQEVYALFEAVMAVGDRLPGVDLPPVAQQALAGHIFDEAPLFVYQVGRALRTRGELFDDVHVDAEALLELQRRALAWEGLQGALQKLARWAGALYIKDQAGAVLGAMSVLKQVRGDEGKPFPHPRADERSHALLQAEEVLADRETRKRRKAARGATAGASSAAAGASSAEAEASTLPVATSGARPARDRRHAERATATQQLRRAEAWLTKTGE